MVRIGLQSIHATEQIVVVVKGSSSSQDLDKKITRIKAPKGQYQKPRNYTEVVSTQHCRK